jgi:lysophospholipase L1-like esterase
MSHKPGIDSEESWPILLNDLSTGNPKYLLWLLGMNDGDDADANTPSESWITHIQKVIAICEERGITPILATIPTCLIYNEGKNSWVRNSGYRYIDFAKAVGANGDGSWYDGMLNTNNDNVHPTDKGARALAMQVLLDFPEITKR